MTVADKLDLYFRKPSVPLSKAGKSGTNPEWAGATCKQYSTLYLLRKDVRRCFRPSDSIYWPGLMAVFAGIDLMAKVYAGTDTGKIGARFEKFVQQFMSPSDGDVMWKLRNSVMHSFGVCFTEAVAGVSTDKRFRITAMDTPPVVGAVSLFSTISAQVTEVNIKHIHRAFATSIDNYESYIRATGTEQSTHFEPMFDKYGWIWLCEQPSTGSLTTFVPMASGG